MLEFCQWLQATDVFTALRGSAFVYPVILSLHMIGIAFFGAMSVLTFQLMQKMDTYKMTIIDLPMNLVYGVCMLGFAAMCLRAMWVTVVHWQRGFSVLERPESTMQDRD